MPAIMYRPHPSAPVATFTTARRYLDPLVRATPYGKSIATPIPEPILLWALERQWVDLSGDGIGMFTGRARAVVQDSGWYRGRAKHPGKVP